MRMHANLKIYTDDALELEQLAEGIRLARVRRAADSAREMAERLYDTPTATAVAHAQTDTLTMKAERDGAMARASALEEQLEASRGYVDELRAQVEDMTRQRDNALDAQLAAVKTKRRKR